jgi:uncharacterized protein
MRVILDTNILCSALMVSGGLPDRLYLAWRDRLFTLVTSDEQLEEFRRVTRYPRIRARIEPSAAGTLHNELQHLPLVDVSPDPWDNYLLSMAQVGKADFLVTADKRDVLPLNAFGATRIVTAWQMLGEIGRL